MEDLRLPGLVPAALTAAIPDLKSQVPLVRHLQSSICNLESQLVLAGVAELADARDLKSLDPDTGRAGSTAAPGSCCWMPLGRGLDSSTPSRPRLPPQLTRGRLTAGLSQVLLTREVGHGQEEVDDAQAESLCPGEAGREDTRAV